MSAADFSPDGGRVVLSVDDRTARIWDLASNRQILALSGHLDLMQFAAFAPDGQRIVTASDDVTARIWDTRAPPLAAQIAWVAAAEFDPLSSTQRAALGLSAPADVRNFALAHSGCDQLAGAPYDPERRAAGVAAARSIPKPAIAACAPCTAPSNPHVRHYEYGRALAAANQAPAARAELERAIARGYHAAGIDLAQLLMQPPAAATDITRAIALLEHAWSQGATVAAFELEVSTSTRQGAQRPTRPGLELVSTRCRGGRAQCAGALWPREQQAGQTARDPLERRRHQLEAFRFYASAAERARREAGPMRPGATGACNAPRWRGCWHSRAACRKWRPATTPCSGRSRGRTRARSGRRPVRASDLRSDSSEIAGCRN